MSGNNNKTAVDVVDIRVTRQWVEFIMHCLNEVPWGEITVEMSGGQPSRLITQKLDKRFDRPNVPVHVPIFLEGGSPMYTGKNPPAVVSSMPIATG